MYWKQEVGRKRGQPSQRGCSATQTPMLTPTDLPEQDYILPQRLIQGSVQHPCVDLSTATHRSHALCTCSGHSCPGNPGHRILPESQRKDNRHHTVCLINTSCTNS